MGKPKGKRPLARPRRRWKDNIVTRWGGTDWINLLQDRDQWQAPGNTVINLRVRRMLVKF
jgi:hypothetical protein